MMTQRKQAGSTQLEGEGGTAARAIAPDDHVPRLKVLHRTTRRVKLNRTIIVGSELANKKMILNKLWGNQNIIKMQGWMKNSSASRSDR